MRVKRPIQFSRATINIFICTSLFLMLTANIQWNIPLFKDHYKQPKAIQQVNIFIRGINYTVSYINWMVGLKNYWRQFSPVSRTNWKSLYYGQYSNGEWKLLPLPNQSERTFWERNVFDFRENKFQLNIYDKKRGQKAYMDYLCNEFQTEDNQLKQIRLDVVWTDMTKPEEIFKTKKHTENPEKKLIKRYYLCTTLLKK